MAKRQQRQVLLKVAFNLFRFVLHKRCDGVPEARVADTVPGVGKHRFEAPNQFVLPLCAGIKALQAQFNGQLYAW